MSGTPILAITDGTNAAKLIRHTGTGLCINNEHLQIRNALNELIFNNRFNFYKPDFAEIEKHNREYLTSLLAVEFESIYVYKKADNH